MLSSLYHFLQSKLKYNIFAEGRFSAFGILYLCNVFNILIFDDVLIKLSADSIEKMEIRAEFKAL